MTNLFHITRIEADTFGLDKKEHPDLWVEVVPLAWLPFEVVMLFQDFTQTAEEELTPERADQLGQLLDHFIVRWSVQDIRGEDIPQMKDDKTAWRKLPMKMIMDIMEAAAAEDAAIPTPSESKSSADSPAATSSDPPNRAERRAAARS